MNTTSLYIQTWAEARTRFENLLKEIKEEDLTKKLVNAKNTAGFLIRHIGDVELLFTKNVFGVTDLKVHAKTVIAQHDSGEWVDLQALLDYQQEASNNLKSVLEKSDGRIVAADGDDKRIRHQNKSRSAWENHLTHGLPCGATRIDT